MPNNTTVVITDMEEALSAVDKEVGAKPGAIVAVGGPIDGAIFDLNIGETLIGRGLKNTMPIDLPGISRKHVKITVQEGDTFVEDLGSSNGTRVNNQLVNGKRKLFKNDVINIGVLSLKFIPKGDPDRLIYDKLNLDAVTDELTGCYNKTFFNSTCDMEMRKSKIMGHNLSLIIIDLDHFKKVNDTHGHDAGDFILKEMPSLIRNHGLRAKDIFARYGGEEFVVLLPETDLQQAADLASRLRALIQKHKFMYGDIEIPVTGSFGVSQNLDNVKDGVELFKLADQAVYKSKEDGRNRVSLCTDL
ncbi:MAG: GGDEF domain-containing protein [Bacteriovoracaceae bacterium]|nr:GGDEF domain-containing protein [Bacteriovoracaceae bacterium]